MIRVRAFGRFWWNFVVGDDWQAALGIAIAIGVTAALAAEKVAAWWFLPPAVAVVLAYSLYRETRSVSAPSANVLHASGARSRGALRRPRSRR